MAVVASANANSRQLGGMAALKSEEYRQLFGLPPGEVLIKDFNCALREKIHLQGHMYLFVHYICFYSNLFGFETKKIIPFQDITAVRRANGAVIFPTSIDITAAGKKYIFTSLLSRDEAFKLINDGWLEHVNGENAVLDQQDSTSKLNEQESDVTIERNKVDFESKDSDPSPQKEVEVLLTFSGAQNIGDEGTVVVPNTACSSSTKSLVWELEDSDAPNVPEYYTLVAKSKFPIKVEEFFTLFFSNEAAHLVESYHKTLGDKDLKLTSWKPHNIYGRVREVSYKHPTRLYFGARVGICKEVQKYRVHRNSHLVVNTSHEINDVPYGDYFCLEGIWDVEKDGEQGCSLRVYVNVKFFKKTMLKGKIMQAAIEECRKSLTIFIELAHDLLKKQKKMEQEAKVHQANTNANGDGHEEAQKNSVEHAEMPHEDGPITSELPVIDVPRAVNTPLQGSLTFAGPFACAPKDHMMKTFSTLEFKSHSPSFMVIVLAMVILTQVSIIQKILLHRPQQVQVISEADWMRSIRNERRAETMVSLDKQVSYLNQEMFMVQTLLGKNRRELEVLALQLKKLLAHDLLKQKKIGKKDGDGHEQAQGNPAKHAKIPHEHGLPTSELPDINDRSPITTQSQGKLMRAGVIACAIRDSLMKLFSSLMFQNYFQSLIVIVLTVVILTQVNMMILLVLLLLRPQLVQIISESDWVRRLRNERRAETMVSLDKQVSNLKEEMLVVETLLKKMKHDLEVLALQTTG